MKKLLVYTLFATLLFSLPIACKKKKQESVVIEYPIFFANMMEIDTSEIDSLIIRETDDFPTQLDGELAKNNTNKSRIKSAKLTALRIQMLDVDFYDTMTHSDFGFLSEIMIDIKKDPLPQKLVASKLIPNQRTKAVNFNLEDVELKEYLQQDVFRMVFKYRKRKSMPNDLPFYIAGTFKIIADPL
jgi:hypothetical protein